ncbi:MAG: alkaline phosphatase D family protein [Silanimonas sp.]
MPRRTTLLDAHAIDLSNRLIRRGHASRRDLLKAIATLGALAMLPSGLRAQQQTPRFVAHPFALGVASGYPRPDGITLWTRLAPLPLVPGGGLMPDEMLPVTWEVSDDEAFTRIVITGEKRAVQELGHSVHVDVRGLRSDRSYFYRFRCGPEVSPTGRTRTAPAPGERPSSLRFAIGSCQHYEQGYFGAYRQLIADNAQLMVFLGDYIYESSWGENRVRRHHGPEPYALEDYRVRHAQYKTDPDLQAAHGAMPWLVTWDDHEVDNDPAGAISEHLDPRFLLRRAAAYQAYWEHMPLPATARPQVDGSMRLHDRVDFGGLARFFVLDNRQHRSRIPCPTDFKGGGSSTVDPAACPERANPEATLLGAEQEAWLDRELARGDARWTVIAQQTLMAPRDQLPGDGEQRWTDGWDGYPAARERLLASLQRSRAANPLVVGGDIHATIVGDVHREGADAPVASEICGTSITSSGSPAEEMQRRMLDNPHLKYGNSTARGYVLIELGDAVRAQLRAADDVTRREPTVRTEASFSVEAGRPGIRVS